jgi:hypothetical protein
LALPIPALSTDVIILAATAGAVVYGIVVGHRHLVRESISVYVGLVLASTFGGPLHDLIHNNAISQSTVQLVLLLAPIVLLQFGHAPGGGGHHGAKHSMIVTVILAVLSAMLIVSSVISQLDDSTRGNLLDASNLAAQIYNLRLFWLALVPAGIAASAIFKPHHHH